VHPMGGVFILSAALQVQESTVTHTPHADRTCSLQTGIGESDWTWKCISIQYYFLNGAYSVLFLITELLHFIQKLTVAHTAHLRVVNAIKLSVIRKRASDVLPSQCIALKISIQ
jgi:hypothetical protein